jgi:hypothetical protein
MYYCIPALQGNRQPFTVLSFGLLDAVWQPSHRMLVFTDGHYLLPLTCWWTWLRSQGGHFVHVLLRVMRVLDLTSAWWVPDSQYCIAAFSATGA